MTTQTVSCVTWNVHRAVGRDGRCDGARIVEAIAEDIRPAAPRILALQEADADDHPHGALFEGSRIEELTGLRSLHDEEDMRWGPESSGYLGNVLFLGPEFDVTSRRIVELPGHCPRAAILAETRIAGQALRIVSCHLSLLQMLRVAQLRLVAQVIARRPVMQTVLLGDLNEWRPWGGLALQPRATGLRLAGPRRSTFPSGRPVLPLDRILTDRPEAVRNARALSGPTVRAASDHLPLGAEVAVQARAA
ncbi:endonuclease [Roseicyclus sp. F158]|uniref:Endonuclease n=1 Tax=Tropicimonas omnivorans TaxID=3075590 RepID=A0ABU3DI21_9RHOB|nr:endonuclease/exonuclease/phosphatase family protein [Roseicyclus sp. F158]MDT0683342.1 endonuclease [Roseicyclus sp. F158]